MGDAGSQERALREQMEQNLQEHRKECALSKAGRRPRALCPQACVLTKTVESLTLFPAERELKTYSSNLLGIPTGKHMLPWAGWCASPAPPAENFKKYKILL